MKTKILISILLGLIASSACTTSRVITLSTGDTWKLASLPCDRAIRYSGYSVTVKNIGLPTSIPETTYTIGEVAFSRQKLEEAKGRVQELDAIQYRMCQQTNALVATSNNDQLIAKYLESSDATFVKLVDLLRQFDESESEKDLEDVTDQAEDLIEGEKQGADELPEIG